MLFVLVVVAKAAKESATRSRSKISLVFTRTVENACYKTKLRWFVVMVFKVLLFNWIHFQNLS